MTIKGILLDFGGTLDSNGRDWYDLMYQLCLQQGLHLDYQSFVRFARTAGTRIFHHSDIGLLSHGGTVRRLLSELRNQVAPHFSLDAEAVAKAFVKGAQASLARNRHVVEELSRKFRLGVLSNNWGNAQGWCEEYGYHHFLHTVVDSGLVGISKPEPGIFEVGIREMGLPPREIAYVGDRYQTDMVGAKNVGLKSVWIRYPHTEERLENDKMVDHVIGSLPQLLDVVRQGW